MFVLRSSKTHGKYMYPQTVKISSTPKPRIKGCERVNKKFCPFQLLRDYSMERPKYRDKNEAFFIFSDREPVKPEQMQQVLRNTLKIIGLNEKLYTCTSFRAGRTLDLHKMQISVESIKNLGRWKSNAVFTYMR